MYQAQRFVGVIITENAKIFLTSELLLVNQTEEAKAHFTSETCCILEPDPVIENQTNLLIAWGIVDPSGTIPVRVVNVDHKPVKLKSGTKMGSLKLIDTIDANICAVVKVSEGGGSEVAGMITDALADKSSTLTASEKDKLAQLLLKYEAIISRGPTDLGMCTLLEHRIDTGDANPIRMAPRRIPYFQQEEVQKDLESKEAAGIVRKSNSPWAFPIVVVRKKDGTARTCVDYRKLNDVTKKDAHPLPRIDDIFDALRGTKYFSTLDLASGYHQVAVAKEDQEKTGFVTPWGHYEYTVMPFGLCNAPATFQRLMALVFSCLIGLDCLIYLDDIIIFAPTFDVHLIRLEKVFSKLQNHNLKIKLSKCCFGRADVKFLRHEVSSSGIAVDQDKVSSIQDWKLPQYVSEMRSFLGLASYYRRFIEGFGKIAAPLTQML